MAGAFCLLGPTIGRIFTDPTHEVSHSDLDGSPDWPFFDWHGGWRRGFDLFRGPSPAFARKRAPAGRTPHLATLGPCRTARGQFALPSLEKQHRHHSFLGRRATDAKQPGAELQKFVGRCLGAQFRRLRQSGPGHPARLPPGGFHPETESFLRRPALQRRNQRPDQARSPAGHSLVPRGLRQSRPIGLQRALGCGARPHP